MKRQLKLERRIPLETPEQQEKGIGQVVLPQPIAVTVGKNGRWGGVPRTGR